MSPPSPSPPSPLNQFESLTIDPEMSLTSAQIRSRAVNIRDILSSFDRDVLPSEFKPQIFDELDRPSQARPPVSQWTIQEDLSGTLLQWGVYNEETWEVLIQLQSPSTLARCFYEKLRRRFDHLFDEYDQLAEEPVGTTRANVERVARGFRDVVKAVSEDRSYRELGHEAIARRLLEAMIGICQRHVDIVSTAQTPVTPRRGTRRSTSTTEGPSNLYEALIKTEASDQAQGLFMLDVLETFSGQVFQNLETECSKLASLLDVNNAAAEYTYRIGRLPSRSLSTAPPLMASNRSTPSPSAEPSTSSAVASLPQAQAPAQAQTQAPAPKPAAATTKTGSKRSAEASSMPTRRGKKKAT